MDCNAEGKNTRVKILLIIMKDSVALSKQNMIYVYHSRLELFSVYKLV